MPRSDDATHRSGLLQRPHPQPAYPLAPLPTTPGIYPEAQPHVTQPLPVHAAKPARSRPMLWVGKGGARYLRGPRMAFGGFGKVYPVLREDGELLAGKMLRLPSRQTVSHVFNAQPADKARKTRVTPPQLIEEEVELLAQVGSSLRVLDQADDMGRHFLIMPWMQASLRDLRRLLPPPGADGDNLRSGLALRMLNHVAIDLSCAHDSQVLHLDVKPENILVGSQGQLRLSDYGLATRLPTDACVVARTAGTPLYQAPEIFLQRWAGRGSDIFSLAVTASVIVTGRSPLGLYPGRPQPDQGPGQAASLSFGYWHSSLCRSLDAQWPHFPAAIHQRQPAHDDAGMEQHHVQLDAWAQDMVRTLGDQAAGFVIVHMMAFSAQHRPPAADVAGFFSDFGLGQGAAAEALQTLVDQHRRRHRQVERVAACLRQEWSLRLAEDAIVRAAA